MANRKFALSRVRCNDASGLQGDDCATPWPVCNWLPHPTAPLVTSTIRLSIGCRRSDDVYKAASYWSPQLFAYPPDAALQDRFNLANDGTRPLKIHVKKKQINE